MLKVTVLMENDAVNPVFKSQWGLSLLLEYADAAILYDTGQDASFFSNAEYLGMDLNRISHMVLSHGHYDHTGGLAALLSCFNNSPAEALPPLIGHPAVLTKRHRLAKGKAVDLSMPSKSQKALVTYPKVTFSTNPLWLNDKIVYLGQIPRKYPHLTRLVGCLTDNGLPDTLPDDSGLAFVLPQGLAVITGCAHAGVVNIIEHAKAVTGVDAVCALIGGLHLHDAPADMVTETLAYLDQLGVAKIYYGHCTGEICFGAKGRKIYAGEIFTL